MDDLVFLTHAETMKRELQDIVANLISVKGPNIPESEILEIKRLLNSGFFSNADKNLGVEYAFFTRVGFVGTAQALTELPLIRECMNQVEKLA